MAKSQYTVGYSIGVGAVVCHENRVLFARSVPSGGGHWQLPGGFVEQNELLEAAVLREVQEETGIECAIHGIVAVRNCLYSAEADSAAENSLYVVFRLSPVEATCSPRPDGVETDAVRFLSAREIEDLALCPAIFKTLAKAVLAEQTGLLRPSEAAAAASKRPYMLCF
jgi:ADP-ribose pyrophosphatase YjhB (NUDIX family)